MTQTIEQLVAQESQAYGVPTWISGPTVLAESGGDPNALSPTGAVGLLQLEANYPGASGQNLRDPKTNLDIGLAQMAAYLRQHPEDMQQSLTSYEDVISHTGWDQWGGWASEGGGDVGGAAAVKQNYINAYNKWTGGGVTEAGIHVGPFDTPVPDPFQGQWWDPFAPAPGGFAPPLQNPIQQVQGLWGELQSAGSIFQAFQKGLGWMVGNPGQAVLLLIVVLILIAAAFHSMGKGDVVINMAKKAAPDVMAAMAP
jgi:hypothetical protein